MCAENLREEGKRVSQTDNSTSVCRRSSPSISAKEFPSSCGSYFCKRFAQSAAGERWTFCDVIDTGGGGGGGVGVAGGGGGVGGGGGGGGWGESGGRGGWRVAGVEGPGRVGRVLGFRVLW